MCTNFTFQQWSKLRRKGLDQKVSNSVSGHLQRFRLWVLVSLSVQPISGQKPWLEIKPAILTLQTQFLSHLNSPLPHTIPLNSFPSTIPSLPREFPPGWFPHITIILQTTPCNRKSGRWVPRGTIHYICTNAEMFICSPLTNKVCFKKP